MSERAAVEIAHVEEIGRAIRSARKSQGLTQQDFADLSGVGARFLSELERGKETAEIGLVLKVLRNAGFDLVLFPRSSHPSGGRRWEENE